MTSNIFKLIFLGIISSFMAYVFYAQATKLESKDKNTESVIKRLQQKNDTLKAWLTANSLNRLRIELNYKDSIIGDKNRLADALKAELTVPRGEKIQPFPVTSTLTIDDSTRKNLRAIADSLSKIKNNFSNNNKNKAGTPLPKTRDSIVISKLIAQYNSKLDSDLNSLCIHNSYLTKNTDSIIFIINYATVLTNEISRDESQLAIFVARSGSGSTTEAITKDEKAFNILSLISKQTSKSKKLVVGLSNELCNTRSKYNTFFKLTY